MKNCDLTYKKIKQIPLPFVPMIFVIMFTTNILGLALPLTMKKIYSTIIVEKSIESLRFIIVFAFIALILESIMKRVKLSSVKWVSAKYEYRLDQFLTYKLLNVHIDKNLGSSFMDNFERFKSVSRISNFYSNVYYQLLIDVPFAGMFLYLIYLFGGVLVMVPIVLMLIYFIVVLITGAFYFDQQTSYMDAESEVLNHVTQSIEKIHLIKAAGMEESQISKYRSLLKEVSHAEFISNRYYILPTILAENISQMALFATLIGGGFLLTAGQITFPQITACVILSGRSFGPIKSLMQYYLEAKEIKILENKLKALVDLDNQYSKDIPMFPNDVDGHIELIGLTYTNIHTGRKEKITCTIASKEFVVFDPHVFPSYKETFLKISGRQQIDDGKVIIDSLDITEWNMHSLTGKIEHLRDGTPLYDGSVLDNITYFDDSKIQSAYESAKLVGLHGLISEMSEGYATMLDSHGKNYLTSDFLQRLAIARALVVRPRILLVDRLAESMDLETYKIFYWLLQKLKGETTIIMATSDQKLQNLGHSIEDRIVKEVVYE